MTHTFASVLPYYVTSLHYNFNAKVSVILTEERLERAIETKNSVRRESLHCLEQNYQVTQVFSTHIHKDTHSKMVITLKVKEKYPKHKYYPLSQLGKKKKKKQ